MSSGSWKKCQLPVIARPIALASFTRTSVECGLLKMGPAPMNPAKAKVKKYLSHDTLGNRAKTWTKRRRRQTCLFAFSPSTFSRGFPRCHVYPASPTFALVISSKYCLWENGRGRGKIGDRRERWPLMANHVFCIFPTRPHHGMCFHSPDRH